MPHHYLEEQATDNISIYSQSFDITVGLSFVRRDDNSTETRFITAWPMRHYSEYVIQIGDNFQLRHLSSSSEASKLHEEARLDGLQFQNSTQAYLLRNVTSLIPLKESFFENVLKQVGGIYRGEEYHFKFRKVEINHLWNLFKNCTTAAIVLPSQVGYEKVKFFEKLGCSNVYQGAETFYEDNVAFTLSGLVPHYLVQRLMNAERCGLWSRWQILFER